MQLIAFTSDRGGGEAGIYLMAPDGTDVRTLAVGMEGFDPAWSPDGTRIVFAAYVASRRGDAIFVMNADGTGVTRLTDGTSDDLGPALVTRRAEDRVRARGRRTQRDLRDGRGRQPADRAPGF